MFPTFARKREDFSLEDNYKLFHVVYNCPIDPFDNSYIYIYTIRQSEKSSFNLFLKENRKISCDFF